MGKKKTKKAAEKPEEVRKEEEEVKKGEEEVTRLLVLAVRYDCATKTYTHLTAVAPVGEQLLFMVGRCYKGEVTNDNDGCLGLWPKCLEVIEEKKEKEPNAQSFSSTAFALVGPRSKEFDPSIVATIQAVLTMPSGVEFQEIEKPEWSELVSSLYQVQAPMFNNNSATSSVIVHIGNRLVSIHGLFGKRTIQGFRSTDFHFMLLPAHPSLTQ